MSDHKILNPLTNRMVKKSGKIGRLLTMIIHEFKMTKQTYKKASQMTKWIDINLDCGFYSKIYFRKRGTDFDFLFYQVSNTSYNSDSYWCLIKNIDVKDTSHIMLDDVDNVVYFSKFQRFQKLFDNVDLVYINKMIQKNEENEDDTDVLEEAGVVIAEMNGFKRCKYYIA